MKTSVEDFLEAKECSKISWPLLEYAYKRNRDLYTAETYVKYKNRTGKKIEVGCFMYILA